MIDAPPVLEMSAVGKSFATPRGEARILSGVQFAIRPGDFVALTGPSGSGKSTLLNLAALLDLPTTGQVRLDGEDTSGLDQARLSHLRKHAIGMVFQKFCLLPHRTARDNVLFRFRYLDIDRADAERRTDEALAGLGLEALARQPARLLSGGEMQRVAIARAVALRPRLLIADEPTGNLDREATRLVMDAFQTLNRQGITLLMATHNERLLSYCTRHLECRNGTIHHVYAA
jgi:putative ABC transport system ATP-binding protein